MTGISLVAGVITLTWDAIPGRTYRAEFKNSLADPTWTPLFSAPYPDHTSGHMCLDGAHLRTLQTFFGTDVMHYGVTSSQFGGETRFFDRFSQPLEEIVEARIWAGLHFRTADVQARQLGTNVADFAAANYFEPVGNH